MTFSKEDILSALDKMLEDRRLLVSARNKQFLRFVVKEVLAGRGNRIKAYTVAVDVFGRPANFDGNADAIVRIEASRLRAALAAYYRDPEVEADFEISLPRGSYAPTITPRSERTTEAKRAEREHDSENDLSSGTHGSAVIRRSNIASPPDVHMPDLIGFAPARQAMMAASPVVFVETVEALSADEPTGLLARTVTQMLIAALKQYNGIAVARKPVGGSRDLANLLEAHPVTPVYRLSSEVHIWQDNVRLWWSLGDMRTMEVYGCADVEGPWRPISSELVEAEIAAKVAAAVADSSGLIHSLTMRAFADPYAIGYPTVVQAQRYIRNLDPETFRRVRGALEQTVAAFPNYAEAWAYLAYIYAAETRLGPTLHRSFNESIGLAREAAASAQRLASFSVLTQFAAMNVNFQAGDDAAFEKAAVAMLRMSPTDPQVLLVIGNRLWARGRWDDGIGMVRKAIELSRTPGSADELVLALDAYRQRNYHDALAIVRRIPAHVHSAAMVAVASHGQLGQVEAAKPYIERLLNSRPLYAQEMRTEFRNFRVDPSLTDYFVEGMKKGGFPVSEAVIPPDAKPA